jgi:antitoxin PrlF
VAAVGPEVAGHRLVVPVSPTPPDVRDQGRGKQAAPLRASCLPGDLILTIIDSVRIMEPIMSTEATLTSKGQTTIPKPIRDSLGMKTGDRMSFTLMPDGVVIMRVKNKRMAELAGLLHKKGRKPLPVELLSR